MVRTTVGTIAEAQLSVETSEAIESILARPTSTVSASGVDTTVVRSPSGTVLEVIGLRFFVGSPSGATAGDHLVTLSHDGERVEYLSAASNFGDDIAINGSQVATATRSSLPGSAAAQSLAIQGLIIDDTTGLEITYRNNTDASQSNARNIDLVGLERSVT